MTMRRAMLSCLTLALLGGCSGPQLLNALTPDGDARVANNIVFEAGTRLELDIYSPPRGRNAPVVVFFYGGRWSTGSKEQYQFVGQALASQGFVAVLPEYRHYPEVRFPTFVQDAALAVVWIRENIVQYGGDAKKLFVMGHSSGAHLAALLALNPVYLKEAGGERAWLRGMIGLAGAYDFLPLTAPDLRDMFGPPERFELSQPVNFVDGEHPPLLLLHGEDDASVDVRNTQSLAAAAIKAGGPVETVLYSEMSHSWIVATLATPLRGQSDVLAQVTDFVRRTLSARPAAAPKTTPGAG